MEQSIRNATFAFVAAVALVLAPSAVSAQTQTPVVISSYAGESAKFWKTAVAEPFAAETGIPTEIFESPLPSASVINARGQPQFSAAIVAAYQIPNLENFIEELSLDDVPNLKDIPEKYWVRTGGGRLAGVPVNFSYLGIAYNTELARPEDFPSWRSLTEAKWKDRISISRPAFVAAYDLTLYAKISGGNENNIEPGIPLLEGIARNALNVYTSMASVQAQLGRGEIAATPFYSGQVSLLRTAGVKNIAMMTPKEGGLLLPYVLVIPKGARNLDNAKRLLNAVITPDYQVRLAAGANWPINPNAKLTPELEELLGGSLADAMARNYAPDWHAVGKANPERSRLVEEIIEKVR
jgi:putative spermidine/putrescine transport system substrate-binding protein